MNLAVINILSESPQISYAITDSNLHIAEVYGDPVLFPECHPQNIGSPLLEHVPELIGYEVELASILTAQTPQLLLNLVNRTTADERTLYVRLTALPYLDDAGQIRGIIHLLEDVSEMAELQQNLAQQRNELMLLQGELKATNDELRTANATLRRINEAKSTFVAMASHELRTPLTCIEGFLDIVLNDRALLSTAHRRSLDVVQRNAIRLRHVVTDLLDLARVEFGQIDLFLKPTDLSVLIVEACTSLMPLFAAKSQQVNVPAFPKLPLTLCDSNRVLQILTNLLSNAHKYTPAEGRIDLQLQQAEDEDYIQLSVADNGMGISDTEQVQVFERFFRSQEAQWQQETGVGLGLYITRILVELHGGKIWFDSIPNQGTTFHVTLPVMKEQDIPA